MFALVGLGDVGIGGVGQVSIYSRLVRAERLRRRVVVRVVVSVIDGRGAVIVVVVAVVEVHGIGRHAVVVVEVEGGCDGSGGGGDRKTRWSVRE